MNKAIIIAAVTLSLVLGLQLINGVVPDYNMSQENVELPDELTNDIPEEAEVVGYLYLDAEMDIFITMPENGWRHEKRGDMVIFYNENSQAEYTSIAFSSSIMPLPMDEREAKVDWFYEEAKANLNAMLEDTVFEKTDNFNFNEYNAYRHCCTGYFTATAVDMSVEYMYWWVGDRQYTCSLFCTTDEFDEYSAMLHEALESFKPASQLN